MVTNLLRRYDEEVLKLLDQSFKKIATTKKTGRLSDTAKINLLLFFESFDTGVVKSGVKDFLNNYLYITEKGDNILKKRVEQAYIRQQLNKDKQENKVERINQDRKNIENKDKQVLDIIEKRFGHRDVTKIGISILKKIQDEIKEDARLELNERLRYEAGFSKDEVI